MRLFVVDDNAAAQRLLRLVLADLPDVVIVGEASSGEEALARVGAADADLVVMDWQMPGMSGIEATGRVLAAHPHLRVVGYTSSGDPGVRQAFVDAGAVAVFAKEQTLELRDWLGALAVRR
jgi:CheY-like chemotaxis protein